MLEKTYDWMMEKAKSKNAASFLFFIAFIESSFFPFPPDPVLAVVVAKDRNRMLYYAFMCTVASVTGGFLGYYLGYEFFELIGSKILAFYGQEKNFESIVETLNKWAFWLICLKGLTPVPYKIVTIACGFAKIDLITFTVASIITRSTRFLMLSWFCQKFGEQILDFFEKNKKLTLILIVAFVVVGFALVKFIDKFL